MVDIVESLTDNLSEENVFVFKVYKSPKDGHTILGYLQPYGAVRPDGKAVTWVSTGFGVPVKEAFHNVLQLAEQYGMSTVLVSDPDNFFPAQDRAIQ